MPRGASEDDRTTRGTGSELIGFAQTVTVYVTLEQPLTGFAYDPPRITLGDPAPTLVPPEGAHGTLSYTTLNPVVCTVVRDSGALTIVGVGDCQVKVTAAPTTSYLTGNATTTVRVLPRSTVTLPTVSVTASSPITEGQTATFTISRTGSTSRPLTVKIDETRSGTFFYASEPPGDVGRDRNGSGIDHAYRADGPGP